MKPYSTVKNCFLSKKSYSLKPEKPVKFYCTGQRGDNSPVLLTEQRRPKYKPQEMEKPTVLFGEFTCFTHNKPVCSANRLLNKIKR